jgi:hypothetical protein
LNKFLVIGKLFCQHRGMLTPTKIVIGFAGISVLVLTYAVQRIPAPAKPIVMESKFDAAWANDFQAAVLKKQDRIRVIGINREAVPAEPVPVTTEVIRIDPTPTVPKLVALPDDALDETGTEPKYSKRTKRQRIARAEHNVCTRHHMRKVVTRGGRSWRCRR